jgi:hypothetical protein
LHFKLFDIPPVDTEKLPEAGAMAADTGKVYDEEMIDQ